MAFSFFGSSGAPIAIDFGTASIKLLQVKEDADRPSLQAAAELPIPDSARGDASRETEFLQKFLPPLLARGKFRGRRAVISVPGGRTLVQHMNLPRVDGMNDDEAIGSQLSAQYGCLPDAIVSRHIEVCEVHRGGASQREMIVLAIPREVIMRYVGLLKKAKLEVVGVHAAPHAMIHAYSHLNRRPEDAKVSTCYINLGWSGTMVAIAHGDRLVFARQIDVGGRHLDEQIATALRCDITAARTHRLTLGEQARKVAAPVASSDVNAVMNVAATRSAGGTEAVWGDRRHGGAEVDDRPPKPAPGLGQVVDRPVDDSQLQELQIGELLDVMSDELSMSIRYHKGLFPDQGIDRVVFVGGESRQMWLCRHLTSRLGVPAQLGDPLTRFTVPEGLETPGLDLGEPQPGWAVACGLCHAPTDL